MNSGLREKIIDALKAKYPDYLTLDELNDLCRNHDRLYKTDVALRRFRNDKKADNYTIKAEKVWNEKHTAIIGYRHIPEVKEPIVYKTPRETITDGLDDDLREIIRNIPSQEYYTCYDEIRAINEALKSSNNYKKQVVIDKYKK